MPPRGVAPPFTDHAAECVSCRRAQAIPSRVRHDFARAPRRRACAVLLRARLPVARGRRRSLNTAAACVILCRVSDVPPRTHRRAPATPLRFVHT
jgi:hypothetical protein